MEKKGNSNPENPELGNCEPSKKKRKEMSVLIPVLIAILFHDKNKAFQPWSFSVAAAAGP